jgi:hypothetical protein
MTMTDDERRAMGKLLRELFLMVRELMPVNADNTRRQTEFSARLQSWLDNKPRETDGD